MRTVHVKKIIFTTLLLVVSFFSLSAIAEESSAMQDLQNANQDSREAVAAPTPEQAKDEAGQTFDTPHDSSATSQESSSSQQQ
jgi:hypothetical protein